MKHKEVVSLMQVSTSLSLARKLGLLIWGPVHRGTEGSGGSIVIKYRCYVDSFGHWFPWHLNYNELLSKLQPGRQHPLRRSVMLYRTIEQLLATDISAFLPKPSPDVETCLDPWVLDTAVLNLGSHLAARSWEILPASLTRAMYRLYEG